MPRALLSPLFAAALLLTAMRCAGPAADAPAENAPGDDVSAAVSTVLPSGPVGASVVPADPDTALFAAGCFWCAETAFEGRDGVLTVASGFAGGTVPAPTYDEVTRGGTGHYESVLGVSDPDVISYERLLDIFWRNVDPFQADGQFCDRGPPDPAASLPLAHLRRGHPRRHGPLRVGPRRLRPRRDLVRAAPRHLLAQRGPVPGRRPVLRRRPLLPRGDLPPRRRAAPPRRGVEGRGPGAVRGGRRDGDPPRHAVLPGRGLPPGLLAEGPRPLLLRPRGLRPRRPPRGHLGRRGRRRPRHRH